MEYRAVFIDLDGTLLNRDANVSQTNRRCIEALRQQGVRVVIATGRPIESVRALVGPFHGQDPAITLSGSVIHPSLFSQPIFEAHIPFETMHSVLADCEALDGIENILLDESEGFYALHDSPALDEFIGMYGKSPGQFQLKDPPKAPVLSIMIQSSEGRRSVYQTLQEKYADRLHFTYFKEYPWIELSQVNTNKGVAMDIVCQYLDISPEQCVAIGDGANDVEMIAKAGLGIAMGNADSEIKQIADRVAPPNYEDGVAKALGDIFRV